MRERKGWFFVLLFWFQGFFFFFQFQMAVVRGRVAGGSFDLTEEAEDDDAEEEDEDDAEEEDAEGDEDDDEEDDDEDEEDEAEGEPDGDRLLWRRCLWRCSCVLPLLLLRGVGIIRSPDDVLSANSGAAAPPSPALCSISLQK